jgi:hypothetical protein
MRTQIYVAGFPAAGFFASSSCSYVGGLSELQEHREHYWHGRYYTWYKYGPWYPGHPGYHSNYPFAYSLTAEQRAEAKKRVRDYYAASRTNWRRPAKKRYIAVQIPPAKSHIADYKQKRREAAAAARSAQERLSNHWVAPESLKCVMMFDTQTKQFVGSHCYAVGALPAIGDSVKFDTFNAEFVGRGT